MPVNIHGKQYVTVAERLQEAKNELVSIDTQVLYTEPNVVIKAIVTTKKGTFTGISGANTDKAIEKMSPYEVAETSAVGRALGFAGFGAIDSIATADEMSKAGVEKQPAPSLNDYPDNEKPKQEPKCAMHGIFMKERTGLSGQHFYDHRKQIEGVWNVCNGTGYKAQNK